MGDTTDGSSSAAHRAQPDGQEDNDGEQETSQGIFSRFISAFSGTEPAGLADETQEPKPLNGTPIPSLRNLRSMRVDDVMLPRAEIVSVAIDTKKDDLVETFRESGLTRLPVFQGTLDSPMGMVHLKDFALLHGFNGKGGRYNLQGMLRPLLYAPPSMPIGTLLQKMQSDRMHMALVIDEHGGVDGLVTIEDLIEQVIGEIEDEHDIADGGFWTVEKTGCYLAQARTPLEDFEAEIGQKLADEEEDEEIDTLGGLVFKLAGRVPSRGEMIQHPDGLDFEVVDADPRRIKRLRVRIGKAEND